MAPKQHPGFSSGRTVRAQDLQYIERTADAELLDHCRNGRPAYILHPPQMGKSSLITHTAEELNATTHHAILIDLSQFPLPPQEGAWFDKIVDILDTGLDLDTDIISWWENHQSLSLPTRLIQLITDVILPETTKPLVLFIDEIERTISLPFRQQIFECLATLYESRSTNSHLYRLSFVICGVATPSQLIPNDVPPLFQWSHRVVLSDFTLQEALPLAEGLSLPTEAAQETVKWIYGWTNGHPYLTQMLCRYLEEQHRTEWSETDVDECLEHFIRSPQGRREPHFQLIRTALTEPLANDISLIKPYIEILEGRTDTVKADPASVEQLQLVGVLRENASEIVLRNRLYQEAFPLSWAKYHLHPQPAMQPVTTVPPGTPLVSYAIAASLLLIGIGVLLWAMREPVSNPPAMTTEQSLPTPLTTSPTPATPTPTSATPEHTEALAHAQEKIRELEQTLAQYQQLSTNEVQRLQEQRNELEDRLASQNATLSDLHEEIATLQDTAIDQQTTFQQALSDFDAERAEFKGTLTTVTKERDSAQEQVDKLQTALLKQSSLSPSEIAQIVADRDQLEAKLTTVNQQLEKAQAETRDATAALVTHEQRAKAEQGRFESAQAQLQTQLNTLQTEYRQTKESLKKTEEHSQAQQTLAQQELARLRESRAELQQQLAEKQHVLVETQQQLSALETESAASRSELEKALENQTTLTVQLQGSQQIQDQMQDRVAQLESDLSTYKATAKSRRQALQQERDNLSHQLTQALDDLETATNRMTTLSTELTSAKQELTNRQAAFQDIYAASSEPSGDLKDQLAALVHTNTDLETQLHDTGAALSEAKLRIARLEQKGGETTALTQALNESQTEKAALSTKLASTQQELTNLQMALKRVSPPASTEKMKRKEASDSEITRILPLITTAITRTSNNTMPVSVRLLWARQAFLFSERSGGNEWAPIDHSLRKALHASPTQLKGYSGKILTLAFDPAGDQVIAGTSDGQIHVWSIKSPLQNPRTFKGHSAAVLSIHVSPNGHYLASGSMDSTVRLWNLSQSNGSPRTFSGHRKGVTSLAFKPDGKQLASGSQDQTIRLWDLTSIQPTSLILGTHDRRVNAVTYAPDGKTLSSAGDDLTLRVWDLQRPNSTPRILRGHQQSISTVTIHPSGWLVATGSRDQKIGLWDMRQSVVVPTFLTGSSGRITQIQFSIDGSFIAAVSSDKSLRIWNWQDPAQPPIHFPDHEGPLAAIAMSPDGQTIAVGGSGKNVKLWSSTVQLARTVCDTASENLSYGDWTAMVGMNIPYERTCPNLPLHPSFVNEGKRLAQQGSREQARSIFERAKQLDPSLKLDPQLELGKIIGQPS